MYKIKVLVCLDSSGSPSSFEATSATLAWYDSIESKSLVEVLKVACSIDDFFVRT